MDLELLKHANNYIEKMANGINPLTDKKCSENDMINNVRISRCLFYVNKVLNDVIRNSSKRRASGNIPFYIDSDTIKRYKITDEKLSISKIASRINELKINDNMKNLKSTDICDWLVSIGLLKEVEFNGRKRKRPTELGIDSGISVEHVIAANSEYDLVVYDKNMQIFIVDNFESLLDYMHSKEVLK